MFNHSLFKTISFFFLVLITLNTSSAISYDYTNYDFYDISDGNGFFSTTYWGHEQDVYLVVYRDLTETRDKIAIFDTVTGDFSNIIVADLSTTTIRYATLDASGYIWYTTNQGIFKYKNKGTSNVVYTNDTSIQTGKILTVKSSANMYHIYTYGEYVYATEYISARNYYLTRYDNTGMGGILKTIVLPTSIGGNTIIDFCILNENSIYFMSTGQSGWDRTGTSSYSAQSSITYFKIYHYDGTTITEKFSSSSPVYSGFSSVVNGNFVKLDTGAIAFNIFHNRYNAASIYNQGIILTNNTVVIENIGLSESVPSGRMKTVFNIGTIDSVAIQNYYINPSYTLNTFASTMKAYNALGGSGGIVENDYAKTEVKSNYATYYNNSKFYISTNIITNTLGASIMGISLSNENISEFRDNYAFKVDIIDSNDVNIKTYYYDGNDFVADKVKVPINTIFPFMTMDMPYLYIYDTKIISNNVNWVTGNYTINLYEINKISGNTVLMDSDTFEVLNESYTGNVIDNTDINAPDNTNLEQKVTNFLNSKMFFALIIIIGVASIAKNKDGGYSFGGLVIMVPIGIIASVVMGFLPVWVLFLMVFVIIAAILVNRGD